MRKIFIILFIVLAGCSSQEGITKNSLCPDCNIVLISIDTLRADRLGIYGYEKNTSPNIDRIAEDSYVFTEIRSESAWTAPSHAALLFSQYPHELNFVRNDPPGKIDRSETSLAEVLKENGYLTQAFTGNGWVVAGLGFDEGFDEFRHYKPGRFEVYWDDALAWITENASKKHFLFLHGYNVHTDYRPPEKYRSLFFPEYNESYDIKNFCPGKSYRDSPPVTEKELEFGNSQYDAELYYADELIGQLWDKLIELNQTEKTILIITSDHGEEFYDHKKCDHVKTLYEEQLLVPLIIFMPNASPKRIESTVQLSDIYPTILELVGIPVKHEIVGKSLVPLFDSTDDWNRPQISITQLGDIQKKAITTNGWKLIETSPTWQPVPFRRAAHKPIRAGNESFLLLKKGQDKLNIDLDYFEQFAGSKVFFSVIARANNTPAQLRVGFRKADNWKEIAVPADRWISINSSPYTIRTDSHIVRMIMQLAQENDSILIDKFSLINLDTDQVLMNFEFDGNDRIYEMYNLAEDPRELHNLVYEDREMLIKLKNELDEAFSNEADGEVEEVPLEDEIKEMLTSLGYLQ